ncbi:hypothetical protein SPRG_11104 [Saprolegnia parasitica CBS 223.65]|uniref:N-alpha-acetyltransferase 60 n=1 Tax=Saprolegnia parasitica (strain CBS 223.65) TaxID=695850 RepID=A0A067CAV3_SAPPC|nr:hypothetical protein SPRG_11104 [Saprolegnia parasitica CBS 223.65]KDO23656.1 hypothetical protein SPRG_11104 [Saprolegnia parasitica CBS 223.65]|eukprot:XP_012205639.1 hypothetical protein SPRG_11104 [Saprolegnia parasitica CBS 223.65]
MLSTPGSLVLRRLEPRDIPQLQALHEDWFPIRYNDSFYQNAGDGLWETGEPLFTQVAAEHDEVLVGAVTAQIQRVEEAEDKALLQSAEGSLILPERGIASVLLETCIQEAASSPQCSALYLHVKADNYSAIRFYEKNGFQRLRFLQDYYMIHGHNHNAYLYIRYINGGSAPSKWIDVLTRYHLLGRHLLHDLVTSIARPLNAIVSFFSRLFHTSGHDEKACSIV